MPAFVFALTIFLSAFLLFQIQPLIGRYLLPWFGGGAAIWTTCLLFFQTVLLAGYGYAHLVQGRSSRLVRWGHLALLLASLAFLPVVPDETWKPAALDQPIGQILLLLLVTIGLPYMMLSATGPLLQAWFGRAFPTRSPYRLYALSNAGSMIALVTYPVVIEPLLGRGTQAMVWSVAYVGFVVLAFACAVRAPARMPMKDDRDAASTRRAALPGVTRQLAWLVLSACGAGLLLATTNQLCQEVANVPFLWVVPLVLYLLTFIICFDHARWYRRAIFGPLLVIALGGAGYALYYVAELGLREQVLFYGAALFAGCMTCHGELVRLKPHRSHLTRFYLMVAAGGAAGGALVVLVAPVVFRGYWELHVALVASAGVTFLCWIAEILRRPPGVVRFAMLTTLIVAWFALATWLWGNVQSFERESVVRRRSFYGVLRVEETDHPLGRLRRLYHGVTKHGAQFTDPALRGIPVSYYGPSSAIEAVLGPEGRPLAGPMRVGIVGLGAGSIAAYGQPGDVFRFYEIDPNVAGMAREYFTMLDDSAATCEVVLGDARRSLELEVERGAESMYDVLILDAFNSGAIPMHLLTREGIDLYWRRLRPDGILMLHISNRFVDLRPIVRGIVESMDGAAVMITSVPDAERELTAGTWVIVAREGTGRAFVQSDHVRRRADAWPEDGASVEWTDEIVSLWPVVRF